jgi:hypothetical protein
MKYYSYENLFVNRTTQYFADIAQYKSYAKMDDTLNMKNWAIYKSTLFRFFDYYAKQNNYNVISKVPHEILSRIHPEDLIRFFEEDDLKKLHSGKRVNSKRTKNNTYSHISSFFKTLSEHSYVNNQNFSQGRDFSLSGIKETAKIKSENYLNEERFTELEKEYDSFKKFFKEQWKITKKEIKKEINKK